MKNRTIHTLIQVVIITAIAAVLSHTILRSLTSMLAMKSSVEVKDYQMSDLYNVVTNNSTVRELSKDVIIVGADGLSRDQIASAIDYISACNTKAISVDILFEYPYESDSTLINSITKSDAVLAAVVTGDKKNPIRNSYFCNDYGVRVGAVNVEATSPASVVRDFEKSYPTKDSQINSFAMELAGCHSSKNVIEEGKQSVFYHGIDFVTIQGDSLQNGEFDSVINDKIVIIGDLNNSSDMHNTPIGIMSGVQIHASITNTILNELSMKKMGQVFNWIIAILSCMLFVAMNFFCSKHLPVMGKLTMRLIQILCLYLFFVLGCWLFASKHIYVDFSLSITMIALGLMSYDIWCGVVGIGKKFVSKVTNKKKNKQ